MQKVFSNLILIAAVILLTVIALNHQFPAIFMPTPTATTKSYSVGTLQSDVQKVVSTYQPITVSIVISQQVSVLKSCVDNGQSFGWFFFPGDTNPNCTYENVTQKIGGGSGFVVRNDGIIMTNKHVVSSLGVDYTVLFNDGSQEKVIKIYKDPANDVALLKVNLTNLPAAILGNSDNLQAGQFVIAIGNALGEFRNSASFGIVSGLARSITAGSDASYSTEKLTKVIQTDAAINPGNSGGPLLNLNGEVVGMNTAVAANAQNIGFALPINGLKNLLPKI